jgi:hypothetical protein
METKAYTLDFGSNVTYHQIQDGGSRHLEKAKTVMTQSIFCLIPIKFNEQFRDILPKSKRQNRK